MTENLTIFTSTINRHEFLEKLLLYYDNNSFKGKILIGDSSKESFVPPNHLNNLNFEIYKYNYDAKQIDIYYDLILKTQTKLAVYTGDDDYLDIDIINDILSKCLNNENLVINYQNKYKMDQKT